VPKASEWLSLLTARPLFLIVALVLLAGGSFGLGMQVGQRRGETPEVSTAPAVAALLPSTEAPLPPAEESASTPATLPEAAASKPADAGPELVVTAGRIAAGDTLARALVRQGISPQTVDLIAREMRSVFDFRKAHSGDHYRMIQAPDGSLIEFTYETRKHETYRLQRQGERYIAEREEENLVRREARIAGVVTSNLYDAVTGLGEKVQLAGDFSEIFAWDVDFSRAVQPGDEFAVVYERLYRNAKGREEYVRPGRILAAQYRGGVGKYTAVYFQAEEGKGGYYRPDGSSVRRQFLATPVRYSRISSNYTFARRHPILNIVRPHQGIDYAAPAGTPVWAVADGTVVGRSWSGGFGNLVKIHHTGGYISYYGHLSRYANSLRVGDRVHQMQVIGYVGSTGLSTGPHLCFRIQKDGRYVNPASLQFPPGAPVSPLLLAEFKQVRDDLLADLTPPSMVSVNEAL